MPLPDKPSLEWLRKHARQRHDALKATDPAARLAKAQFEVAKEYGFPSWRALKAHIEGLALDGQLFAAADAGDVETLAALLDEHPDKLHVRDQPYAWTLLHRAAARGQLATVDLLLTRGLDANVRERGDNTCAMHWAAAAGHLHVVRRLADAGGDVIGHGDDHDLEVIGWATCWEPCHDAVAEFLVERGARHHIFSAIAMDLAGEVRRIVAADPAAVSRRMSRNEAHQLPLHFAVRKRRTQMVALLLELGADPLGVDGDGFAAAAYATAADVDRPVMQAIAALTAGEIVSADRGRRRANAGMLDVAAAVSLHDWTAAARLLRDEPDLIKDGGRAAGALHLMSKRGDTTAVTWLLQHGADVNARWAHWNAVVTPLHLAAMQGHASVVRLLLDAGADATIRDTAHDSDPQGWAEFFKQPEIVRLLDQGKR